MNAKQAEQLTGISRRNLRFYEQQGLIHPERNPENDYRDYNREDIEHLKMIRALRMLDTPLEDIHAYLHQELSLEALSTAQEQRLRAKQQKVEAAILVCRKLQAAPLVDGSYIDNLLTQMDAPDMQDSLFDTWKKDYRKVAAAEARKSFCFTPDDAIKTPQEFTLALFSYANAQDLNLVVTKEGLEPEFTIDGVAYYAQRIYRRMGPIPVMVVKCSALHPEQLETDVKGFRGKFMKLFHNWWWILFSLLLILPLAFSAESPEEVLIILASAVVLLVIITSMYWVLRNYRD